MYVICYMAPLIRIKVQLDSCFQVVDGLSGGNDIQIMEKEDSMKMRCLGKCFDMVLMVVKETLKMLVMMLVPVVLMMLVMMMHAHMAEMACDSKCLLER